MNPHPARSVLLADENHGLREGLRGVDLAARYGGEEFALVLDGLDGERAVEVCDRLRARVGALAWDGPMADTTVTVSIGVSAWSTDEPVEAPFARADAALYGAKSAGRNRVHVLAAPSASR